MSELIVPTRRGLLAGLAAVIASPAIVRADSLMLIRGELLDPRVLAYAWGDSYKLSVFDPHNVEYVAEAPQISHPILKTHTLQQRLRNLSKMHRAYCLVRKSELEPGQMVYFKGSQPE